jgi:hypothetical protein
MFEHELGLIFHFLINGIQQYFTVPDAAQTTKQKTSNILYKNRRPRLSDERQSAE